MRLSKPETFNPIALIKSKHVIGDTLSVAQETCLRALYGLPLDAEMHAIYERATLKSTYSAREYREACIICGRRSGKDSRLAANTSIISALASTSWPSASAATWWSSRRRASRLPSPSSTSWRG